jgi:hypothetical protein
MIWNNANRFHFSDEARQPYGVHEIITNCDTNLSC